MKMKRLLSLVLTAVFAVSASAQTNIVSSELSQAEIDRIIKKFTQNEALFREALNVYVFSRKATVQTIGMGGQISGTFRLDSLLTFDGQGRRIERIEFAPISTLTEIQVSQADLDDMGGLNPFAIEPKAVPHYNFTYLGKERIDELDLHVFDVAPKVMPAPKKDSPRFFLGRIWVDDEDLMIVKSKGKAIPEWKNERFPVMETWRENIDGKYWFPSFTSSDDELVFESGQVVKMRVRIKYADYKLGRSDVKIIGEEEDVPAEPAPSPAPGSNKPE